ncbi:MAG: hypothetical protein M3Z64_08885 [Verrucomicrobiota bacterium]|nr:hypothetical protein [Verrucomicrobiota bacterium]
MPADPRLEIGHILFIDVVGYSRLLNNEQHQCLQILNRLVRQTDAFRGAEAAGGLTRFTNRRWHGARLYERS